MSEIELKISEILSGNSPVDEEWVEKIRCTHPTFVVPMALLLKQQGSAMDAKDKHQLQAHIMLGCSDQLAMSDLANTSASDWQQFYPKQSETNTSSTTDTIDRFLNTYGKSTPTEDALLEKLIFNPVPADYFPVNDEPQTDNSPVTDEPQADNSPVDDEPLTNDPPSEMPEESEAELPTSGADGNDTKPREEPLFMESLAKIFIKQRRYERAFEIINNLSLKYPEKSAYFADQLRFLQKLIINQRLQLKKSNT